MKNSDIDKKNESFKRQNNEAEKTKTNLDSVEKKLHQPNRPSV
ncbi:MAG: hypothetical protein WDZ91_00365 [Paenibacillaceae bacterium]